MVPRLSASIEAQKNTLFHSGTGIFGYREETAMQTESDLQLDDSPEERRRHLHLRVLYDDASNRIEQFFRHRNEWAGSSINYLAQRIIHDAYPYLNAEDVRILVAAIERVHHEWGTEAAQMDEIVTHFTNALQ